MEPGEPQVRSAVAELTALALACRSGDPNWDERGVRGALLAAQTAGWTWPRTLIAMAQLIAESAAEPRDLLEAVRNPLARKLGGTPPTAEFRQVAARLHGKGGDAA